MRKIDPLTKAIRAKVAFEIQEINAMMVAYGISTLAMSTQHIQCSLISNEPLLGGKNAR